MKSILLLKTRKILYTLCLMIDRLSGRFTPAVILNLHSVSNESTWKYSNTLTDLDYYLSTLTSIGYTPVKLSEIVRHIQTGSKLPKKTFAVTFDDGYKNIMSARSVLKKYGVNPTVFVLSRPSSAKRDQIEPSLRLLTPKEVTILAREGWEIGVHSRTHAEFSKLTESELVKEVVQARSEFAKTYRMVGEYFAYPKGYYNSKIVELAKKAGYVAAFTVDNKQVRVGMDLFTLPRVGIDHTHKRSEFRSLFSPTAMKLKRMLSKTGVWNLW